MSFMKTGNISVALGLSVLSVLYSCNNERFIDETSGEIRQIAMSRNGENGEWAKGTKLFIYHGTETYGYEYKSLWSATDPDKKLSIDNKETYSAYIVNPDGKNTEKSISLTGEDAASGGGTDSGAIGDGTPDGNSGADGISDGETPVEVDMSSSEKLYSFDFLYSDNKTAEVVNDVLKVNLGHALSKIVIKIGNTEGNTITKAVLKSKSGMTRTGWNEEWQATGENIDINAYYDSEKSTVTAYVIPQASYQNSVVLTLSDGSEVSAKSSSSKDLVSGKEYIYNLSFSQMTASFTGEITVNDWTTEENSADLINVWDGVTVSASLDGEGTAESPYLIKSGADLALVRKTINEKQKKPNLWDAFIRLKKDIDLGGHEWIPIGTSENGFSFTFDGGNHTVKNFKVSGNGEYHGGLFFGVQKGGASVSNLIIENAIINSSPDNNGKAFNAGALAGYYGNGRISNCIARNCTVMSHEKSTGHSGGLVGSLSFGNGSLTLENCHVENCKITSAKQSGGIVGSLENGKLIACSALSVEVNGLNAGGISGQAYNKDSEIIGCYASGKISASSFAGGISGMARGKMTGCYSAGIELQSSAINNSVGTLIGRYIIENKTGEKYVSGNSFSYYYNPDETLDIRCIALHSTKTSMSPITESELKLGEEVSAITEFTDEKITAMNAAIAEYGYEYVKSEDNPVFPYIISKKEVSEIE